MSKLGGFIIGHVVVRIAQKGSEIILHKRTTKFRESVNIRRQWLFTEQRQVVDSNTGW